MRGLRRSRATLVARNLSRLPKEQVIALILEDEKTIGRAIRWSKGGRKDYTRCSLPIHCKTWPSLRLYLALTALTHGYPRKSNFTLLLNGERILSLDVEPKRGHTNPMGTRVHGTHWHCWPCDTAERDDRVLPHQQWFADFLKRARIEFTGRYRVPPTRSPDQAMFQW